jgi:hypothetical protein
MILVWARVWDAVHPVHPPVHCDWLVHLLHLVAAHGVGRSEAGSDNIPEGIAIILRYRGCGVWILAAFWGMLFQLAVSPFNWIDKVMEEVGKKARREVEMPKPSEKAEDTVLLFEGKNPRM